jgi:hypothetical protein
VGGRPSGSEDGEAREAGSGWRGSFHVPSPCSMSPSETWWSEDVRGAAPHPRAEGAARVTQVHPTNGSYN